jgi:hypothetical protein
MEEKQYQALLALACTLDEIVETEPNLSRVERLGKFIYLILHAWKAGQEVLTIEE